MEQKLEHLVERKRQAVIEALAGSTDKHAVVADHRRKHTQKEKVKVSDWMQNDAKYGSGQFEKKGLLIGRLTISRTENCRNQDRECRTSESTNVKRSGLLGEGS